MTLLLRRLRCGIGRLLRLPGFCCDLAARLNFLCTVDDDLLTRRQTLIDNPFGIDSLSEFDRAGFGGAVILGDIDHRLALGVAKNGALRNGDGVLAYGLFDAHAHIHAGQQVALRIGEFRTQRHLTGGGIDAGAGKEQAAGIGIDSAVIEDETDTCLIRGGACQLAIFHRTLQRQHVLRRLGEIRIDGVDLLDQREVLSAVRCHERAFGHQCRTDDAGNGRADLRIIKVDLGFIECCLLERDIGIRLCEVYRGGVVFDAGRDIAFAQVLLAFQLLAGVGLRCLRALQRGLRALTRTLKSFGSIR